MDRNKILPHIPQNATGQRQRETEEPDVDKRVHSKTSTPSSYKTMHSGRSQNFLKPKNSEVVQSSRMDNANNINSYIIPLKRTPSNLTPSQRLQLRRNQISDSIVNYRLPGSSKTTANRRKDDFSCNDMDLEEDDIISNVPISSFNISDPSLVRRGAESNRHSTNTNSTRTSSIWSRNSLMHRQSTMSVDTEASFDISMNSLTNNASFISLDSEDISFRLEANEAAHEHESSREKWRLLTRSMGTIPTMSLDSLSEETSESALPAHYHGNSKSLNNLLSYTRPTWLPPKSPKDRAKHHKEASKIFKDAMKSISTEERTRLNEIEDLAKQREEDKESWNAIITEDTLLKLDDHSKLSELYWRGIPSVARSTVWGQILQKSSTLGIGDSKWYLKQVNLILQDSEQSSAGTTYIVPEKIKHLDFEITTNTNLILGDSSTLKISEVRNVVWGVIFYLNERNQLMPITRATSHKIRTEYFSSGLLNLVCTMMQYSKDTNLSFIKVCNLLLTPTLLDLTAYIGEVNSFQRGRILDRLHGSLLPKFDSLLDKYAPNLRPHFTTVDIKTEDYLPYLAANFLSQTLGHQTSCQFIDIYIMEGEDALLSIIVAALKLLSHKLYGTKEETLELLGINSTSMSSLLEHKLNAEYNKFNKDIFSLAKTIANNAH